MTTSAPSRVPEWKVWARLMTVYLVWGSTYLAIRITVRTLPPLLASGARFLVAGLLLCAWVWFKAKGRVRLSRPELAGSAIVGIALIGANSIVMVAEQSVPSGVAALIIASVPLWIAVLKRLTGDALPPAAAAGVVVGFVGVAILLLPGAGATTGEPFAFGLVVFASMLWATGSWSSNRLTMPQNALAATAIGMVAGGSIVLVVGAATGELAGIDVDGFSTTSVLALLYLTLIGSLVGFTSYVWLLSNAPLAKVATYAYVNPVVAIFLGWALLSEQVTMTTLVGASLIVVSVATIVRQEMRPARPDPAVAPAP